MPLLKSRRCSYQPPASTADALIDATQATSFVSICKDQLISNYLNGPRTLSSRHLSHLFLASSPQFSASAKIGPNSVEAAPSTTQSEHDKKYDILFAATHFIGDGMALHNFADEFFSLLAVQDIDVDILLEREWRSRCSPEAKLDTHALPRNAEDRLPPPGSKYKQLLAKAEFENAQSKLIGGHVFPRPSPFGPRHTVVPTVSYDADQTKRILRACKSHGVSISNAIFALCAVVWSLMDKKRGSLSNPKLPMYAVQLCAVLLH